MTAEQQRSFRDSGCLCLHRSLGRREVDPLRAFVFGELKRLRVWAAGKPLSGAFASMPPFQQVAKLSTAIRRDNLASALINDDVRAIVASLSDTALVPAQSQFLISLPRQGSSTTKGLNWHTDVSPAPGGRLPGIQAFVLVDDVKPGGGATLAIAGSHRAGVGPTLRRLLRGSDDLDHVVRSQGCSVVEMSGRAGDVYLMDMRVLHTPSINTSDAVRVMATVRFLASN